jgi:hypothetical protein
MDLFSLHFKAIVIAGILFSSMGLVTTGLIMNNDKMVNTFSPIMSATIGVYIGSTLENHYDKQTVAKPLTNAPLTDTYIKELLKDKYLPDNVLDGNVK